MVQATNTQLSFAVLVNVKKVRILIIEIRFENCSPLDQSDEIGINFYRINRSNTFGKFSEK
ncbi:SH3 domain-binding protein 5-like protein [Sarcoptes scabiei]|nr:SH3 domain-binding protein 5-like protein [Sarcoptes scabiei]